MELPMMRGMKESSFLAVQPLLVACCVLVAVTTAQCGFCPSGWQPGPVEGKCFSMVSNTTFWNDAEAFCRNQSGHLAAITSKEELQYTQHLCGNATNGCWVGGRGANSSWKWSDGQVPWNGSLFPDFPSALSNCSSTGCDLSQLCILVRGGGVPLVRDNCNTTHAFLCAINKGLRCHRSSCHTEYFIIIIVVSALISATTGGVVLWLLCYRQKKRDQRSNCSANVALVPPSWRVFAIDELRMSTKNFSDGNRLGGDARTGGTYRGVLADGSLVAIKRLKKASFQRKKDFLSQSRRDYLSQSENDFLLEVGRIARYCHPNLVAVKGCCFKHGQKYIVYEFLANGPLDRWLHHLPKGAKSLDWAVRMQIAITLAQGIAFLHDKVKPHIVHGDIRASNVLLDEEFSAHILGVGLSKFVPWETVPERNVMAGTYGYLAPEFVYHNELTTKSDVYSFGVLLLELISGRQPTQRVESVDWQSIFEWATPLVQSQNFMQLLDPVISSVPEVGQIQKVVELVYACTQHVPSMRPRMSYVVHQLQQLEVILPEPTRAHIIVSTTSAAETNV